MSSTPRFLGDHPDPVKDSFFFRYDELPDVVACSRDVKFPTLQESGYNPNYKEILKKELGWDLSFK